MYALGLHREQTRKGTAIPYAGHLLRVAGIVIDEGGSETQAIAALLHDAVEDQGGAPVLLEIRERFGAAVADIVEGCTDADAMPKPPWETRKRAYVAHLREAPADVLLVSCADKLDNARAILADYGEIGSALWTRFGAPPDRILWYYRSLADIFLARGPRRLAAELDRVVTELHEMAR
jgi:GTP pyrophosphokinase